MKLNKPKNPNYAAIVVQINTLVPLENCDNVQGAIIMGNQVIVEKDVKIGDVGIYFPLEAQLSTEYLKNNNLYRKKELNIDDTKAGYFEENGRIRCIKFRGNKSEGLFMPMESLQFAAVLELELGSEFDELNGIEICRKYVVKVRQSNGISVTKGKGRKARESKLIDNQFRFHEDTSMLYKNLHKINPDSLIHISYKMHGTSGISSYVLCKRNHSLIEKLALMIGISVKTEEYDYIYSSRKVIKNPDLNPNAQHYYSEDVWGAAHKILEPFLQKGMTFYYEIVGYTSGGKAIQSKYDYGQQLGTFGIYIYRITSTNADGKVIEFNGRQVQEFCKKNGLNAVPQLFSGYADYFIGKPQQEISDRDFQEEFLAKIKALYNEKDCFMCENTVPEEGCVIRIEGLDFEAYKAKSNAFYERETKLLDKGEVDIEEEN